MSERKEQAVKRRDFRSVKDRPEAPGPLRGKKDRKQFEVLSRYKPEFFKNNKDSWVIFREARKSNNAWRHYGWFCSAAGAEQAVKHWERDHYWGERYEFKIMDCRGTKG